MKTQVTLRLSGHLSSKPFDKVLRKLPPLEGRAVAIRLLPDLSAGSRKLYSRRAYGQPVFAASFIRKREIVLDRELADKPNELARILTHELFHFVWVRLGNPTRRSFGDLLRREFERRARGELGWSAESRKLRLAANPHLSARGRRRWGDYTCESFCDTAAWLYSGVHRHKEFTLGKRERTRRAEWFGRTFAQCVVSI